MARIISVGTAVPEYKITQQDARTLVQMMYRDVFPDIDHYLGIFDNAGIEERYLCKPKEWFMEERTFAERNAVYVEEACKLGERAVQSIFDKVDITPQDVDALFFVSTTGLATPSIDAYLINHFRMNPHMKRTPIWGLGCAGGVSGLARAMEAARAFPKSYILLVTVELCGLTFCKNDLSKSNFVATSLFADGAAAVLLAGDDVCLRTEENVPRIVSAMSTLWPDSEDVMGWDVVEDGLKVVFSKEIPRIILEKLRPAITHFLSENKMDVSDIQHNIFHPGGMKVIGAYQECLDLPYEKLQHTASVLRSYGNMSSPTVLFVLERELQDAHAQGNYGLMFALGPGFSLEMLLLRWE